MLLSIGFFLGCGIPLVCAQSQEQDPLDAVHAYLVQASQHVAQGRYEEAIEAYGQVLKIEHDDVALAKYYFDLAVRFVRQGNHGQARQYFTQCLELDPDHQPARALLEMIETASRNRTVVELERQPTG